MTTANCILSRFFLTVLMVLLLSFPVPAMSADKENCLMCHKYIYMGRIDADGNRLNYHVDEALYASSLHHNVACRECHTYITKFPHDAVREPVNCGNTCHIKPPHAMENFSHQKIIATYDQSIHGVREEDSPERIQAKPHCKYCHLNPRYTHVDEERIAYEKTLQRCLNCHLEEGVTQAYKHMAHRLRHKTTRSPQEIVHLCATCHDDEALMKKFGASKSILTAVKTYKRSIHGKKVMLGSQAAADCISCHASASLHDIYKKENPASSVYEDNLAQTCKQCHTETNERFIQIAVHPRIEHDERDLVYYVSSGLTVAMYATVLGLVGLMMLETFGRRRDGMKMQLKNGSSWRGRPRSRQTKTNGLKK